MSGDDFKSFLESIGESVLAASIKLEYSQRRIYQIFDLKKIPNSTQQRINNVFPEILRHSPNAEGYNTLSDSLIIINEEVNTIHKLLEKITPSLYKIQAEINNLEKIKKSMDSRSSRIIKL